MRFEIKRDQDIERPIIAAVVCLAWMAAYCHPIGTISLGVHLLQL
jgi:hypothetical protein